MQTENPWKVQRAVVFALIVRELKTRFGGRWEGALWTLSEPLAHVLFYALALGSLRASRLPNIDYPIFLATGLLPFFTFRTLSLRLSDAVRANRALFNYRPVKPFDTFIARAFLEAAINSAILIITFLIVASEGSAHTLIPDRPLEWIGVQAILLSFGFGIGVSLSVVCHFAPRIRMIISLLFLPLYMLSAIQMPIQSLPTTWQPYLLWNPLLHLFEISRSYFFPAYPLVGGLTLAYPASGALLALSVGLALYRVQRFALLRET